MKNITILKKYLTIFTLIIVLPILIIGFFVYYSYSMVLLNNFSEKSSQTLDSIALEVDSKTKESTIILSKLINEQVYISSQSNEITELLTKWNRTKDIRVRYELSKIIDNKLDSIFTYFGQLETIVFYFKEGGFYFYNKYPDESEFIVKNSQWYSNQLKVKNNISIIDSLENLTTKDTENNIFSAAISLESLNSYEDVELVYLAVDTEIFNNIKKYEDQGIFGETLVLDSKNNIIFSKEKELIGKKYTEIDNLEEKISINRKSFYDRINNEKVLVSTRITPKTNWKIINITPYKDIMGNLSRINKLMFICIMGILGLFIIFSIFFLRGIIIPVQDLTKEMRKVKKGDLNVAVKAHQDGEIGELGSTFNTMVNDIKNLMQENRQKEREKSEAEIDALQAQINPHFISNTLSSIRFMAMIAKVDNIREMTEAFINITSASFNRNSKFNTIEKEIETLESYVYIMKVRHGNKYDVIFEIDNDIKEYYILKMIIQPILENAILHGVSDLEHKGTIIIRGKREESNIIIEVEDNGNGISNEEIEKLLSIDCRNTKGFTSIGVRNVDRRIKLNFGEEYGLFIESVISEYTRVKIRIPLSIDN